MAGSLNTIIDDCNRRIAALGYEWRQEAVRTRSGNKIHLHVSGMSHTTCGARPAQTVDPAHVSSDAVLCEHCFGKHAAEWAIRITSKEG